MEWFKEGWLSSDSRASGVYMALLFIRLVHPDDKQEAKEIIKREIEKDRKIEERDAVWEAVDEFIEKIYSISDLKERDKILENIEERYYEKFKDACYKHLKLDEIKKYGEDIARVLRKVKESSYSVDKTKCGSIRPALLENTISRSLIGKGYISLNKEEQKYVSKIYSILSESRILWFSGLKSIFKDIIPAPYLEEEFLEKLEKGEIIESREEIKEIRETGCKHKEKLSEEILESMVGDIIGRLGFKVEKDKMTSYIWGKKTIGGITLYVYVSCKNWNKKVDEDTVFSEIGRITHLNQCPHLKILVCKELTGNAREIALREGFIVIELKEKVNSENAEEIAENIYNHLNELFTGLTPPELQRIVSEAKRIINELVEGSKMLKSSSEKLENLAKKIDSINISKFSSNLF